MIENLKITSNKRTTYIPIILRYLCEKKLQSIFNKRIVCSRRAQFQTKFKLIPEMKSEIFRCSKV